MEKMNSVPQENLYNQKLYSVLRLNIIHSSPEHWFYKFVLGTKSKTREIFVIIQVWI